MRPFAVLITALFAAGCNTFFEEGPERNCETRTAYYPDADADGVGEPGAVYIACAAPAGWVDVPPSDSDASDSDPVDSDPVDSDPVDSDPVDSDAVDSDPPDSDAPDTDTDAAGPP
jgi:hypothetical protein